MNVVGINSKIKTKVKTEINNNCNINKDAIEKLQLLLNDAKQGKLLAFACTVLSNNDEMENVYCGNIKREYLGFMGMLTDMQIELKKENDNG